MDRDQRSWHLFMPGSLFLTSCLMPEVELSTAEGKKKRAGGHSWLLKENVSSENKELDLFAVFPPLHTVNVDEHSCIIFELLLSWKMRSKSIEDERVSVCVAELRKSFRGELCLFSEIQTVVVLLETAFKSSVLQCLSVILSFFYNLSIFCIFRRFISYNTILKTKVKSPKSWPQDTKCFAN